MADNSNVTGSRSVWTRRRFVAASGVTALLGDAGQTRVSADEGSASQSGPRAIDFPASYLYCTPTNSGIRVRVQMECRGCLSDAATGKTDEYVMGVVARTGLAPLPGGARGPGYDYWIIFSKSHVFTKRSHSSAYLNNPTVLARRDFGEASWRLKEAPARPLRSAVDIRSAIERWHRITAKTVFTSTDGARRFSVEYPVKWADYAINSEGFRVETGPVFLLDPDRLHAGSVPAFEDFQWAHLDYHAFDRVRCLLEQPTSILADATFSPPAEHGRENRKTAALTQAQVDELKDALGPGAHLSLPEEIINGLLSTDHYSRAVEATVGHELYALAA